MLGAERPGHAPSGPFLHLPKVLFLVSLKPSAAFICPKELKASHGGRDAVEASAAAVFVEPVAPLASLTWTAMDFSASDASLGAFELGHSLDDVYMALICIFVLLSVCLSVCLSV